ncbi:alpha/beta hydrolase family protein [Streptomyces profundus]|uniref:alpha/beta hydrolase family protein n=1 Tax=Streptomyces profundus TaxID=2867410 RepID=UPI001D1659D5|nr:alpha/beta hydrolase [Streptomyces sp. MA3_2.13]UED85631.1 alpha/beta hydrolase [Streptomyces sp. MA3_2.13]
MSASPVSGTAAGVPFTALPPAVPAPAAAPLLVTWHMMDAPRTDAAFAAALPLVELPAWRVHLGMPWCGAREPAEGMSAAIARTRDNTVLGYLAPVVDQATEEFGGALAALRSRLPLDEGPISVVGGSLGGAVALNVLAAGDVPVRAAAVINAGIRARSVVDLVESATGRRQPVRPAAEEAADRLDFVARAGDITAGAGGAPLLVVSGELDYPALRRDAAELVSALRAHHARPAAVRLLRVPELAHPLAERPGVEPAPPLPAARVVGEALTAFFAPLLAAGEEPPHG